MAEVKVEEKHIIRNVVQYCKDNSMMVFILAAICLVGFFYIFWTRRQPLKEQQPQNSNKQKPDRIGNTNTSLLSGTSSCMEQNECKLEWECECECGLDPNSLSQLCEYCMRRPIAILPTQNDDKTLEPITTTTNNTIQDTECKTNIETLKNTITKTMTGNEVTNKTRRVRKRKPFWME